MKVKLHYIFGDELSSSCLGVSKVIQYIFDYLFSELIYDCFVFLSKTIRFQKTAEEKVRKKTNTMILKYLTILFFL